MSTASIVEQPRSDLVVGPRRGDVALFYASIFGITWGIAALLIFARPQVEAVSGTFSTHHPLYFLAVYAPTLTAVGLTAVRDGRPGLRRLASRLLSWRVLRYYALVLLGWPVLDHVARLLQSAIDGSPVNPVPLATIPALDGWPWVLAPLLLVSTLLLDAGPLGEELGQRGYLLPRLLARRSPLTAALIVGFLWGVWHLPAFLISGTFQHDQAMGAGILVLGTVEASVVMTWIYLRTRGSVLVAGVLVHLMDNVAVAHLWATTLTFALLVVPVALSLHRTGRLPTTAAQIESDPDRGDDSGSS